MTFIKWLGMYVPVDIEQRIFASENPVQESVKILCELLIEVLAATGGSGVPLGVNVESLSIFKEEIDAAHDLFQTLQATLLNSRGSPWAVRWFCVNRSLSYTAARASEESLLQLVAASTVSAVGSTSTNTLAAKDVSIGDSNGKRAVTLGPGSFGLFATTCIIAGFMLGRRAKG